MKTLKFTWFFFALLVVVFISVTAAKEEDAVEVADRFLDEETTNEPRAVGEPKEEKKKLRRVPEEAREFDGDRKLFGYGYYGYYPYYGYYAYPYSYGYYYPAYGYYGYYPYRFRYY